MLAADPADGVSVKYAYDSELGDFSWKFYDSSGSLIGQLHNPHLLDAFKLGASYVGTNSDHQA